MANEIAGRDLWVEFDGTVLSTDFRSFEQNQTTDTIEVTAGADAQKTYLFTVDDGTASLTMLYLAGSSGSAIYDAVENGTEGTLVWAPDGSSGNNAYYSVNAGVTERGVSHPYADVVELNVSWQFSGAVSSGTI